MNRIKKAIGYFSAAERILWSASVFMILFSFLIFDRENHMTLFASLLGVTSLIFNAKGNPFGQLLMVVFSVLYGMISYTFAYYGEMITYLGMTMPMAVLALISWLKNPYKDSDEVKVGKINKLHIIILSISSIIVTIVFYYILKYFNTTNLIISTISISTSYVAAYLTYLRSEYYAVAYGLNDIVLIVLWILASIADISYLPIVFCFVMFLANDTYGFINWLRMKKRQSV